ncbi:MAG: HAMP domain-containing histidine kinase [Thermodesulfobacteria bacterium]|nr:HAMP domain-containing histidine kinase [Thermodesulfobacteriota bacterium]
MTLLPLWPICVIDVVGSVGMILFGVLSFLKALRTHRLDPNNPRYSYLCWVTGTLMAFAIFRAGGHILRHVLLAFDLDAVWHQLAPFCGALNTLSFMMIVGVTLFMRDVENICLRLNEERRKLENMSKEILELNRDMEQIVSERTATELALRIAHQIRNPVMIIGGLINRLAKECPQEKDLEEKLSKILEQVQRLEELVREFETLMEKQVEYFRIEDLNQIVKSAVNLVSPEAEQKHIRLRVELAKGPLLFRGHGQLIKVAIVHVLRNAIEACGPEDVITVKTGLKEGYNYVIIKDTGPGIPKEIMPHIFKPFYSTKGKRTGLGLPYVKQIIEEHRGKIVIESAPGKGTTVKIYLPTHLDRQ